MPVRLPLAFSACLYIPHSGTLTHVVEPVYPGAVDDIVNLGDFWRSDKLSACAAEIKSLVDGKAAAYASAYRCLAAAERVDSVLLRLTEPALDRSKLCAAAARLAKTLKPGSGFSQKTRVLSSQCGSASTTFDTFAELASHRFRLLDDCGVGSIFLDELLRVAESKSHPVWLSRSPLSPDLPDALFLPEASAAFVLHPKSAPPPPPSDKLINMSRFIIQSELRARRQKLRFLARCKSDLLSAAASFFDEARALHSSLESLYTPAMDFRRKEDFTKKLLIRMFR